MKKKFQFTIRMKLMTISFLLLTIPLVILGLLSYQKTTSSLNKLGEKNLKNSVEMTIELIDALNKEVEKGTLSLEEAQEQVKVAILGEKNADGKRPINKNFDLGENGYLYIIDQKGTLIAHPVVEGRQGWNDEDSKGVKFNQKMIKTGNEGGGLTYYEWALPDNENRIEKKSPIQKLILIGDGLYVRARI